MDDPHVFSCHPTLKETIWHSEVGASAAILAAGCEHVSLQYCQGLHTAKTSYAMHLFDAACKHYYLVSTKESLLRASQIQFGHAAAQVSGRGLAHSWRFLGLQPRVRTANDPDATRR